MHCAEDATLSARIYKLITKPYSGTGKPHLRVSWRAVNKQKYNFTILQFYKNKRKVVLFYVAIEEHLDFAKKMN